MAADMGIEMLTEAQYRTLQKLEPVDTKTSSWLKTPDEIRKLGGAIFGDFRYGSVFVYHNDAQSYYSAKFILMNIEAASQIEFRQQPCRFY